MLDRLGDMKRQRGKTCSETRAFKFPVKRKAAKRAMVETMATEAIWSSSDCSRLCSEYHTRPTHPAERFPNLGYQCERRREVHPRSHAVPNPRTEWEGKENERRSGPDSNPCRTKSFSSSMAAIEDSERMVCLGDVYPDDDSNEVLPVEQFFGNVDAVQDCPQRRYITTLWAKREHRRRRYFAKEDSDEEEEGFSDTLPDHRGETA